MRRERELQCSGASRSNKSNKYRVVQLDLTPEIDELYMMFERCHTKIERDLSNNINNISISRVKFSWASLYCWCAHLETQ